MVRGTPPPAHDRGLAALAGLANGSYLHVDVPGRCAASVEATAYFVVAVTNVSKHSERARWRRASAEATCGRG